VRSQTEFGNEEAEDDESAPLALPKDEHDHENENEDEGIDGSQGRGYNPGGEAEACSSAKGAAIIASLGQRPRYMIHAKPSALKARFNARPHEMGAKDESPRSQAPAWECRCLGSSASCDHEIGRRRSWSFGDKCVPKLELGNEERGLE
jgi:hypothetical protein